MAAATMGTAHAAPITYSGSEALGTNASLSYTFTTDGAVGALGPNDFTNFSVVISEGGILAFLDATNSTLDFYKGNTFSSIGDGSTDDYKLTATATTLSFLFEDSYDAVSLARIKPQAGFCIGYCIDGPQSFATYTAEYGYRFSDPQSGNVVFATVGGPSVAAAPEPSVWALMLTGVGMLGAVLRRRHAIRSKFA